MKLDKKNEKEIVHFSFMMKNYYREAPGEHEVKGEKTLKLFKSWFRLAKKTGRLLYGVVKFDDGEAWIWQNSNRVYRGGWHKVTSVNKSEQLALLP